MENINIETTSILKSEDNFTSFTAVIMQPDVDLHGDIVSKEVIKKTAHEYLKNQKMQSKIEHKTFTEDISLVESFVLEAGDKNIAGTLVKNGSWVGKFQVNNDEIKSKIKSGDFKGVSIGATALVENIEKSIENPYKDKPKRIIKDIKELNEISLVSYPANNVEILSLNKKKELENMEKSEDEILKSLDPKVIEILKVKDERLLVLEKAYEENLRKEFSLKVEEIKKYSSCDDSLVDCMMSISKAMPNEYKVIEKSLLDAVNTIKNSDKMKTVGVDNPLDLSKSSGFERIETIAKSLMGLDISLTKEQAIAKVYQQKLYQEGE